MILVDTSARVEFLRDTGSPVCTRVDELLDGEIATCDPVRMEVLAGARDENRLTDLRRLLARASTIHLVPGDYEDAAAAYRTCRRRGETVRKLIDCLIGAVAPSRRACAASRQRLRRAGQAHSAAVDGRVAGPTRCSRVPDRIFDERRLVDIYDDLDSDRRDLAVYLSIAGELWSTGSRGLRHHCGHRRRGRRDSWCDVSEAPDRPGKEYVLLAVRQ